MKRSVSVNEGLCTQPENRSDHKRSICGSSEHNNAAPQTGRHEPIKRHQHLTRSQGYERPGLKANKNGTVTQPPCDKVDRRR